MYVFVISLCIVAAAFVVQRFANQIDEQLNACGTGIFKDGTCECTHPYVGTHCEIVDCGYGKLIDSVFAYDTITTPKGPSGCECEAQYWGYNCANCTSKYTAQCTGPCKDKYFGPRCDTLCKSGTENDATGVLHRDSGGTYNYFVESHGFCLNYGDVKGTVKCREGRAGAHCELQCPLCVYGSCNLDDGTCDCFDGYFGNLCEGTCPGRCSGLNGVCQSDGTCKCYDGFTGDDCSLECCVEGRGTELSSVHGNCTQNVAGCACFEEVIPVDLPEELYSDTPFHGVGWEGSQCDCHENITCGGRGRCVEGGCECTANFQGARCDICNDSKVGPFCQYDRWQCPDRDNANGEFVAKNSRGDYGCKCNSGFTGDTCEECIAAAYPKTGDDKCTIIVPDTLCHDGNVNPDYDGTVDMCVCDTNFDTQTDCASCHDHWYGPDCDHYCRESTVTDALDCGSTGGVCSNSGPGCICPKGSIFSGTKAGGTCVTCGGDDGCANGTCIEGRCRCDPNYYGDNCNITAPISNNKVCSGYPSVIIETAANCDLTADCLDESVNVPAVNQIVANQARIYDRVDQMFCHRDDTPKGLKNTQGCCVDRNGDGFCDKDKLESTDSCTFYNAAGNTEEGEVVNDICNKRVLEDETNVFEWCLSQERVCTSNGVCEDPDLCEDRCDAGLGPAEWVKIWEWGHSRTMTDVMSESWKFASDFPDPYEYRKSYTYENPCPATHPHLNGPFYSGLYWCYQNLPSSGPCNMYNSGIPPPEGGAWGSNQADCILGSKSTEPFPALDANIGDVCVAGEMYDVCRDYLIPDDANVFNMTHKFTDKWEPMPNYQDCTLTTVISVNVDGKVVISIDPIHAGMLETTEDNTAVFGRYQNGDAAYTGNVTHMIDSITVFGKGFTGANKLTILIYDYVSDTCSDFVRKVGSHHDMCSQIKFHELDYDWGAFCKWRPTEYKTYELLQADYRCAAYARPSGPHSGGYALFLDPSEPLASTDRAQECANRCQDEGYTTFYLHVGWGGRCMCGTNDCSSRVRWAGVTDSYSITVKPRQTLAYSETTQLQTHMCDHSTTGYLIRGRIYANDAANPGTDFESNKKACYDACANVNGANLLDSYQSTYNLNFWEEYRAHTFAVNGVGRCYCIGRSNEDCSPGSLSSIWSGYSAFSMLEKPTVIPSFDDKCYRQSTVCTAGCDNYQEGCEGLPLLSEHPTPMPAPCDQHWGDFCTNYMDFEHKEEGVCAYTECRCEGYGIGGPACDMQCPVPAGVDTELSCGSDLNMGRCIKDRGVIAFGVEQGKCDCFNGGNPAEGCAATCEGDQDCSSEIDTPFSFEYSNCTALSNIDSSNTDADLCHVFLRDSACNFFRGRCECATPFTAFTDEEKPIYLNPHSSYRIALMQGYDIDEYLAFTTYNGTVPDRDREAFDSFDPNFKCFKDIEHTMEVSCDWIRALKHFARGGSYRIGDCTNLAPGTDIEYQVPCSGHGFPQGGTCACDYAEEFETRSSGVGLSFEQPGLDETPWRGKACQFICPGYDMESMDSVCSGHGRCESDARCACDQGWTGYKCDLQCEVEQKPLTCSGHGVCDERSIILRGDIIKQLDGARCEHLPECNAANYDSGDCTNETMTLARDRVIKSGDSIYHMYYDEAIKISTYSSSLSSSVEFLAFETDFTVRNADAISLNPDINVCSDFTLKKSYEGAVPTGGPVILRMIDTYGDGWNGFQLNVGGTIRGDTFITGTIQTAEISGLSGTIEVTRDATGTYVGEVSFEIICKEGNALLLSGDGDDDSWTFENTCPAELTDAIVIRKGVNVIATLTEIGEFSVTGAEGVYTYSDIVSSIGGSLTVIDCSAVTRNAVLDDFSIEGTAVRHDYDFGSNIPFMPCQDRMDISREHAAHPLLPEMSSVDLPCNVFAQKQVVTENGADEDYFRSYQIMCGVCNCEESSQTGNWTGYDCRTPALGFFRSNARSQCPGMTADMNPCNGGGTCRWGSTDGLGIQIRDAATKCYCGDVTDEATLETAPRSEYGVLVHASSHGTPLFYDEIDTFEKTTNTVGYDDIQPPIAVCNNLRGLPYALDTMDPDYETRKRACYDACVNVNGTNKIVSDSSVESYLTFWDDISHANGFMVSSEPVPEKSVTLTMIDSYGDGWDGYAVIIDGNSYTFGSGSSSTATIEGLSGTVSVTHSNGRYDSEVSWNIKCGSTTTTLVSGTGSQGGGWSFNIGVCTLDHYNCLCYGNSLEGCPDADIVTSWDEMDAFDIITIQCPNGTEPIKHAEDCRHGFKTDEPYSLIPSFQYCEMPDKSDQVQTIAAGQNGDVDEVVFKCYESCIDGQKTNLGGDYSDPLFWSKHTKEDITHFSVATDGSSKGGCICYATNVDDCKDGDASVPLTSYPNKISYRINHHSHPYDLTTGSSNTIPALSSLTTGTCQKEFEDEVFTAKEYGPTIRYKASSSVCTDAYELGGTQVTPDKGTNAYSIRLTETDPLYDRDPTQECANRCHAADKGYDGFMILSYVPSGNINSCLCGKGCDTPRTGFPYFKVYTMRTVPDPYEIDNTQSICHPSPLRLSNYKSDCSCKFGFTGNTCETARMMCLWNGEETDGTECICNDDGEPNTKVSKYGCCTKGTYWDQDKYASFTPLSEFEPIPANRFYQDAFLYVCKPPETLLEYENDQERILDIHNYVANTDEYLLTKPTVCGDAPETRLFTSVFQTLTSKSPETFTVTRVTGGETRDIVVDKDKTILELKEGSEPKEQCAAFCVSKNKGYKGFSIFTPKPEMVRTSDKVKSTDAGSPNVYCENDDRVPVYVDLGTDSNPGYSLLSHTQGIFDACWAGCTFRPRVSKSAANGYAESRPQNFWEVYSAEDITYIYIFALSGHLGGTAQGGLLQGSCSCHTGDLDTCETVEAPVYDAGTIENWYKAHIYKLERGDTECTCEPFIANMDNQTEFKDPMSYEDNEGWDNALPRTTERYDIQFPVDIEAEAQNLGCFENIDGRVLKINQLSGTSHSISAAETAYVDRDSARSSVGLTFEGCYEECKHDDVFEYGYAVPELPRYGPDQAFPDDPGRLPSYSDSGYSIKTEGTCDTWITTLDDCKAARTALGLSDLSVQSTSVTWYARGCLSNSAGSNVFINTNTGSPSPCGYNSYSCVCGEPPLEDIYEVKTEGPCFQIQTAAECKKAAEGLDGVASWKSSSSWTAYAPGCFLNSNREAYFNTNTGSTHAIGESEAAGATTGHICRSKGCRHKSMGVVASTGDCYDKCRYEADLVGFLYGANTGSVCWCEYGTPHATSCTAQISSSWTRYSISEYLMSEFTVTETDTYCDSAAHDVRPYGGSNGDNPGTDLATRTLACHDACMNKDGANIMDGPGDGHHNGNFWNIYDGADVTGFMVADSGLCYCFTLPQNQADCETLGGGWKTTTAYTNYKRNPPQIPDEKTCTCYSGGNKQIVGTETTHAFQISSTGVGTLMTVQKNPAVNPAPCNVNSYIALGDDIVGAPCNCPIGALEEAYVETGYQTAVIGGLCNSPVSEPNLVDFSTAVSRGRCSTGCLKSSECDTGLVCYMRGASGRDWGYDGRTGWTVLHQSGSIKPEWHGSNGWDCSDSRAPVSGPRYNDRYGLKIQDTTHPLYDSNYATECAKRCRDEGVGYFDVDNTYCSCGSAANCPGIGYSHSSSGKIYQIIHGASSSSTVPGCTGSIYDNVNVCIPGAMARESIAESLTIGGYDLTLEKCKAQCDADIACDSFSHAENGVPGDPTAKCRTSIDCTGFEYKFEGTCDGSTTGIQGDRRVGVVSSIKACRDRCVDYRGFLYNEDYRNCVCEDNEITANAQCGVGSRSPSDRYTRYQHNFAPAVEGQAYVIYTKEHLKATQGRYCATGEKELYTVSITDPRADVYACAQNATLQGMEVARGRVNGLTFTCYVSDTYYANPNVPETDIIGCLDFRTTGGPQYILQAGMQRIIGIKESDLQYQGKAIKDELFNSELYPSDTAEGCKVHCDPYKYRHFQFSTRDKTCQCIKKEKSSLTLTGDPNNMGYQIYDFTAGLIDSPHEMCFCEGFYLVDGQAKSCPSGKYSSKLTPCSAACTNCPVGQFSDAGASECGACVAGQIQDSPTSCSRCDPGQFAKAGAITCSMCEVGRYASGYGAGECTLCPTGKYQEPGVGTGSSVNNCDDCPAGWGQANMEQTDCKLCGVGKYTSSVGTEACALCGSGKYLDTMGSTSESQCKACQTGRYQDGGGQPSCKPCSSGKYQSSTGKTSCSSCAGGKYQSSTGKTSCSSCAGGKKSGSGAASCSSCSAGYYSGSGESSCKKCGTGKYQTQSGQGICTNCPVSRTDKKMDNSPYSWGTNSGYGFTFYYPNIDRSIKDSCLYVQEGSYNLQGSNSAEGFNYDKVHCESESQTPKIRGYIVQLHVLRWCWTTESSCGDILPARMFNYDLTETGRYLPGWRQCKPYLKGYRL